jgi:hypothetical protein
VSEHKSALPFTSISKITTDFIQALMPVGAHFNSPPLCFAASPGRRSTYRNEKVTSLFSAWCSDPHNSADRQNARTFDYLWRWELDSRILGALNTHAGLQADEVATTYLSNHDHSHVAWQAGGRDNQGAMEWYRVQPYAIAQLTSPGCPLIQNGQEFAEDYWIMEDDHDTGRRVSSRPLRWNFRRTR